MIAIALSGNPKILIADEPTTALDVTIQAQIIGLLKDIQAKLGTTIILITHDLGVVASIADKIIVMYSGKIVEKGECSEIFSSYRHPYTWALLNAAPSQMCIRDRCYIIPNIYQKSTLFFNFFYFILPTKVLRRLSRFILSINRFFCKNY